MTTDLTELTRSLEIVPRYWNALANPDAVDGDSRLIPENVLPELRREIQESLKSASRQQIAKAIAVLIVGTKIPTNTIEDKEAFFKLMRLRVEAAGYPADVINEAVMRALDTEQWTPSIAALLGTAEHLVEERRRRLRTVEKMELEHHRRRRVAAQREAQAEREADREAHQQAELERLQRLEAQALEKFGDDGPLPGDIELADPMSPTRLCRAGKRVSWQAALAGGEHWAAKYCRQIALAARARQALEQGRVSAADAVAATKLIITDEASARHQIDDMQSHLAKYPGGQPTESFWRAVWKIAGACGLDSPVFPEDAAAIAINNLKHLTELRELADTRAILDEQVLKEWRARARARWGSPKEGINDEKGRSD
jgi:hypothetical protein